MLKKTMSLLVIFTLLITVALTGCGKSNSKDAAAGKSGDKVVIRVGYNAPPSSTADKGANKFKELVESKSNGKIEVNLFPSSQLGSENDMLNLVQMGSLEVEITGDGPINVAIPQYGAVTMPYVFRDTDHLLKVYHGPIGEEINQAFIKAKGARLIDTWLRGPRNLTANKEIKTPEDLKGVKIRIPEMKVYVESWNRLGAIATPMALSEVYSGLQQKAVDAQENPYDLIYTSSFFEVQKYLIKTQHVFPPYLVLMNEKFFGSLPEDLQKVVKDSAAEAGLFTNKATLDEQATLEKQLQDKGMKLVEVDSKLFQDKLKGLPEELEKSLNWKPGLYQAILDTK